MDIRVQRDSQRSGNYFQSYAVEHFQAFFKKYRFLESVNVFFRGGDQSDKSIKLMARVKGKNIFAEASAYRHDVALELAARKLQTQVEKFKTKRYNKTG